MAAFSYFDKDQSGYITVDELQQACNEFNMGHAHIEEMIKEADQDNVRTTLQSMHTTFEVDVHSSNFVYLFILLVVRAVSRNRIDNGLVFGNVQTKSVKPKLV